ncbi:CHAT domain-containing protein [Floridanema evergladense]|uniref:CHAT domain-containing protein n=1 Tax=Floridaenema evergladense BLCC-F167 TaxID=3153639 RepID=A0ABV4WMF8_9CYAN
MQNRSHSLKKLSIIFLGSLILSLSLGNFSLTTGQVEWGKPVVAQSVDAKQLVQRGVELYQRGEVQGAIAQWEAALKLYQSSNDRSQQAIVLENLARAYPQIGEIDKSRTYWEQVVAIYRQLGNYQQMGRMLTELAQSYSSLGQSKRAIAILCGEYRSETCNNNSALEIARSFKDTLGEAAALGSLGNAYLKRGEYGRAIANLENSLKIAETINNPLFVASLQNYLGNTYVNLAQSNYNRANLAEVRGDLITVNRFKETAKSYDNQALKYFADSLKTAESQNDLQGQIQAIINSIFVHNRSSSFMLVDELRQQAIGLLERLPDSQKKVYAAIELMKTLQPRNLFAENSDSKKCLSSEQESTAKKLLESAILVAQRLKNYRAKSFALGELGQIYECRQDYQKALELTQEAQLAADQGLNAKDSLFLWEWQAGRIFQAQNKPTEAINAYQRAVNTLEEIRSDLITSNRDLQFDFRDRINPIYRELAKLRLNQANSQLIEPNTRTKQISFALRTIDSLKLAELQNYFGNDCVIAPANQDLAEANISSETAIFNSIIFPEGTAIIVSLPNGEKKFTWINTDRKSFRQTINEFRRGLERFRDLVYDPKPAQNLYDLIIRPFAADLEKAQIKTLVFVQDGILRSIPMAALHDGNKFLVENYAIATTPTLSLTTPRITKAENLRALAVGLTKEATIDGRLFPALANVSTEINQIQSQLTGSKLLLDESFTYQNLKQELNTTIFPIIHIATHGEFGSVPEDTFLVTGNNEKLTITQLETAIRNMKISDTEVLELLALTACQTAVGDDRAALGLAGVAVQAGVRSALASLWFINDASTVKVVNEFYQNWHQKGLSKVQALQAAQKTLISQGGDYAHPAYWAPFILIGNWL